MTPAQCRAARLLLGWNRQRLAVRAGLTSSTAYTFEAGRGTTRAVSVAKLRRALEEAGVIFVEENGGGPGVRLRKGTV